jgi:hypothetical protein
MRHASTAGPPDQCVSVAVEVVSSVASGDAAAHAVAVGLTLESGRLARIDVHWVAQLSVALLKRLGLQSRIFPYTKEAVKERRFLRELGRVPINNSSPDVRFRGITGHRKAALNR